jgi:hypothetical protein
LTAGIAAWRPNCRCRRLLTPRGIYLSSDAGPLSQTLLFVVVAPLLGGRRAMFRPPKYDREIVKYFREPLVPERPSR